MENKSSQNQKDSKEPSKASSNLVPLILLPTQAKDGESDQAMAKRLVKEFKQNLSRSLMS